ncbi:hypothetical protein LDENG_00281420 [Lucifuga dentata]|nr:hypothetical protein LDENG_00281420 [Lucifuga dentata]
MCHEVLQIPKLLSTLGRRPSTLLRSSRLQLTLPVGCCSTHPLQLAVFSHLVNQQAEEPCNADQICGVGPVDRICLG